MLDRLRWLGLETARPDAARAFYDTLVPDRLDESDPAERARPDGTSDGWRPPDDLLVYRLGEPDPVESPATRLVLRRPTGIPRGGVHTHYALSIPRSEYGDWRAHLAADYPVAEHDFGGLQSLYVDDPDGHCVELAAVDVEGPGVAGVFEVVLEVSRLGRSRSFYERLGYQVTDDGEDRLRLSGPGATPDLELWTPRIGIAGGRGGVHVDIGYAAPDPAAVAAAVADGARRVVTDERWARVVDPDGHHLTVVE